jgi:hypothetical protein
MTSQYTLYQLLNSVIIDKLQDSQSANMSISGTFSDVMSESKTASRDCAGSDSHFMAKQN